jgi:hypothetical protein
VAELPEVLALAHPGTRYQAVFVELDDMENPIDRRIDPPGVVAVAKKQFEAMCQDESFISWLDESQSDQLRPLTRPEARAIAKSRMGIESANEIVEHPDHWRRLHAQYMNR